MVGGEGKERRGGEWPEWVCSMVALPVGDKSNRLLPPIGIYPLTSSFIESCHGFKHKTKIVEAVHCSNSKLTWISHPISTND